MSEAPELPAEEPEVELPPLAEAIRGAVQEELRKRAVLLGEDDLLVGDYALVCEVHGDSGVTLRIIQADIPPWRLNGGLLGYASKGFEAEQVVYELGAAVGEEDDGL